MPNRPRKTPANNGRADFSGLAGGIGGYLAGEGADANADEQGVATDKKDYARSDVANKTDNPSGYKVTAKPIAHPSFWSNLLTQGRSGLDYNNYLYGLNARNMAGGQKLDLQNLLGSQTLAQIAARGTSQQGIDTNQGNIEKQKDVRDASIAYMKIHDIPYSEENYQKVLQTISDPSIAGTLSTKQAQATEAGNTRDIVSTKPYKEAQTYGTIAAAAKPFTSTIAGMPILQALQSMSGVIPGLGAYSAQGAVPGGTTSVEGFDPKTMQKTTRTSTNVKPGSGTFLPQIDDSDVDAENFNASSGTSNVSAKPNANFVPITGTYGDIIAGGNKAYAPPPFNGTDYTTPGASLTNQNQNLNPEAIVNLLKFLQSQKRTY